MPDTPPLEAGRPPQQVLPGLWLFAPNRDTAGGSSWLLETPSGRVLIDSPAFTEANQRMLEAHPPLWQLFTGRDGHGRARRWQEHGGWRVLVQEQEAYLLPGVQRLDTFSDQAEPIPGVQLHWTPGPSPGACVVWSPASGGLFCGRLLVPQGPGRLVPLRTPLTFHWPRQLRSLERLRAWLPADGPRWIASGAGLGALRGEKLVLDGRAQLDAFDLEGWRSMPPISRPI